MKKFLAVYLAPVGMYDDMMKNMSPEEQRQGMENWMIWGRNHKENLVDFGAPAGKNMRVTKDGMTEVRNEIGGYTIVSAESHEAAAALFADSPHLMHEGTSIDVVALMDSVAAENL